MDSTMGFKPWSQEGQVKNAAGRAVDRATRAHLHDLLKAIDDQLDPKVAAAGSAAPAGAFPFPR